MKSKEERIDDAYSEYLKIKDLAWTEYEKIEKPAYFEYLKIADPAYSKYKKIKDEIEAEPDDVTSNIIPEPRVNIPSLKSDLVQVKHGKLTYFNTPQICHICKEVIQHGDEIEFDAPTFTINDIVHKSCQILSSEPKEQ